MSDELSRQSEIFNLQSRYSYLSATNGSTLVARRAGIYDATSATTVNSKETEMKVSDHPDERESENAMVTRSLRSHSDSPIPDNLKSEIFKLNSFIHISTLPSHRPALLVVLEPEWLLTKSERERLLQSHKLMDQGRSHRSVLQPVIGK
jgi:hypothetical protein